SLKCPVSGVTSPIAFERAGWAASGASPAVTTSIAQTRALLIGSRDFFFIAFIHPSARIAHAASVTADRVPAERPGGTSGRGVGRRPPPSIDGATARRPFGAAGGPASAGFNSRFHCF